MHTQIPKQYFNKHKLLQMLNPGCKISQLVFICPDLLNEQALPFGEFKGCLTESKVCVKCQMGR